MKDRLSCWLAWKLPRRVVYWCAVRVLSTATMDECPKLSETNLRRRHSEITPAVCAIGALKRWLEGEKYD